MLLTLASSTNSNSNVQGIIIAINIIGSVRQQQQQQSLIFRAPFVLPAVAIAYKLHIMIIVA
jgi:hypothetical protein